MMNFTQNCVFCGQWHSVLIDVKAYHAWRNGELIQKAFPNLSATQREQLVSSICPECQNSIFGPDDEEDADACLADSLDFTGQWW